MSVGNSIASAAPAAPRVFELTGKLTEGPESEEIYRALRAEIDRGVGNFVLDLSRAPDINSAGIGFLVECLTAVRRAGGRLILVAPSKRIRHALLTTRLDTVLPVFDSVDAALTSQRA